MQRADVPLRRKQDPVSNLGVEIKALARWSCRLLEGSAVTDVTIYPGTPQHENSLKGIEGKVIFLSKTAISTPTL